MCAALDDWKQLQIWDPLAPNRLSPVDLRDWNPVYRNGDLIVAERGEYFLFWVISLGVCVRCLFTRSQWGELAPCTWLTNGVILIDAPTADEMVVYLVPLTGDASQTLSATVPADVPLVRAREVFRGNLPQRLHVYSSPDPARAPLLQSGSLWTLS